ncbi:MAG: transcriptional regulator NrdR [Coriobacteriales bacterium]|jgi:transcriptional repressor NrdR|nr:transcriptional regulator NrdR [Coriobacteriales bacterium]
MRCVSCSHPESKVIDSRPSDDGLSIRRRRECLKCGARFTTYERHNESALIVIKNDRSSEPFDRSKLLRGLLIATAKRDVPASRLEALIDDVEAEIRNTLRNEVRSKVLGDMVLERLRAIDDVAYIRFASVYKDFRNIDEFQAALKGMN